MPAHNGRAMTPTDDSPPRTPVRYLDLLARAKAHIDANLDGDLGADTLADQAAMSRHHFHRMFRAYFGTSVQGYVTWRRLRRACELLAGGEMAVLEVALTVGYDSAQALAKAMRRELDTTPSAVRSGQAAPHWQRLFDRRNASFTPSPSGDSMLKPQLIDIPALAVLTTTGRGMDRGDMSRAAQQAFGELMPALDAAGLQPRALSCLALFPDLPAGEDDQYCRLLGGVVFDCALHGGEPRGLPAQPDLPLTGSLAWWYLPASRYAVFTHLGTYAGLHAVWTAIYREWLPATGYALRDVPPFELYVNSAETTPPAQLRTDIYIALQ